MKKMKYFLLTVFCLLIAPIFVSADEVINVYIFKSSTCPHCSEAMEFFSELAEDEEYSKYFRLVPFETNGSTDEIKENVNLAQKVSRYFGADFDGVPLIIIGDKKFEGYASNLDNQIKEKIKACYEKSCTDVVAGVQDGTLGSSKFDTVFLILILVVFVGGIGYFIYIARKNPVEEENEELNEKTSSKEIEEDEDFALKSENVSKKETTTKNKTNSSKKKTNKK